jgi:hypothetical protein
MANARDRKAEYAAREQRARDRGYASYRAERTARAAAKAGDPSKLSRTDKNLARDAKGGNFPRATAAKYKTKTVEVGATSSTRATQTKAIWRQMKAAPSNARVTVRQLIDVPRKGVREVTARAADGRSGGGGGDPSGPLQVSIGPGGRGATAAMWVAYIEAEYGGNFDLWLDDWYEVDFEGDT